ncbi:UNVERIFIED_CONTAM: hypothetical protein K2H54_018088 [Gekko kuhli]
MGYSLLSLFPPAVFLEPFWKQIQSRGMSIQDRNAEACYPESIPAQKQKKIAVMKNSIQVTNVPLHFSSPEATSSPIPLFFFFAGMFNKAIFEKVRQQNFKLSKLLAQLPTLPPKY